MTHSESFILRWIEWNEINVPLVDYMWALVSNDKGSPDFRNVMGGLYGGLISPPDGGASYSSMPSVDEIASRYEVEVEVIDEAGLLTGGEAKLTYCIQEVEDPSGNVWVGPPNGLHPLTLFSAMEPIAAVPSSSIDFLRLSLTAAGLPSGVSVEEVRFQPTRTLVKTFKIADVAGAEKDENGAFLKENIIKYYELVQGVEAQEISGWGA